MLPDREVVPRARVLDLDRTDAVVDEVAHAAVDAVAVVGVEHDAGGLRRAHTISCSTRPPRSQTKTLRGSGWIVSSSPGYAARIDCSSVAIATSPPTFATTIDLIANMSFADPIASGIAEQVGEAAVELVDGALEGVVEGLAALHPVREVDRDQLGVVAGLEAEPLLLEQPPQRVVVRELAVVDDRDVGERLGPERMAMGDGRDRLRRHPHVAEPVRAAERRDVVAGVRLMGVAGVLHDLEGVAHRLDLDAGHGVLERDRERARMALVAELEPHEAVGDAPRAVRRRLVVEAAAELAHRVVIMSLDCAPQSWAPSGRRSRATRPADSSSAVEGEAGGVLAAVAHRWHMRTSDEPTGPCSPAGCRRSRTNG